MFFFKPEKEIETLTEENQEESPKENKLQNLFKKTGKNIDDSSTKQKKAKKTGEKPKKLLVEQVTSEMIKEKYEFLSAIINKDKNGVKSRMKDFPEIEFLTTEISNDLKVFWFLFESKKYKSDAKFLKTIYVEKMNVDPKQNKCWDKVELFIVSEENKEPKWRTLNEVVPEKFRKKQKIVVENNENSESSSPSRIDSSRKRKTLHSNSNDNDIVISKRFLILGEIVCLLYENQSQSDLEKVLSFLKSQMGKKNLPSSKVVTEQQNQLNKNTQESLKNEKEEYKSLSKDFTTISSSQLNFEEDHS